MTITARSYIVATHQPFEMANQHTPFEQFYYCDKHGSFPAPKKDIGKNEPL